MRKPNIAILGATGAVGAEFISLIEERNFPYENLKLLPDLISVIVFLMDLQSMFDHLVDITEPICQHIDSNLASMSIFDTSGIEAWVTENNPKYANRIIKQLKAFAKAHNFDKNFDPYKAAYGSMPAHATANIIA